MVKNNQSNKKPGTPHDGKHDDGTNLILHPESPDTKKQKTPNYKGGNMYFNQTSSGDRAGVMESVTSFKNFIKKYKN